MNLSSLSIGKVLSFFHYRPSVVSSSLTQYSSTTHPYSYYCFLDHDKDSPVFFSCYSMRTINADNLLAELNPFATATEIQNLLTQLLQYQPTETPTLPTEYTTLPNAVNLIIGLHKITNSPGWHQLPTLLNRIFISADSKKFKLPLCEFKDRKFLRFTNVVEWNGWKSQYMSANTFGFYTGNLSENLTSALITGHPYVWEVYSQNPISENHFFILVHPNLTAKQLQPVFALLDSYKFNSILLPITNHPSVLFPVCSVLNYYLATIDKTARFTVTDASLTFNLSVPSREASDVNILINSITLVLKEKMSPLVAPVLSDIILHNLEPVIFRTISDNLTHYSFKIPIHDLCTFVMHQIMRFLNTKHPFRFDYLRP